MSSGNVPPSETSYLEDYVRSLSGLVTGLDLEAVGRAADVLDQARRRGTTVFCAGNGGSAATASHLATDLAWGRRTRGEQRPRAISLTANVPLMTALSNDVGYDDVFVEQMNGLFREGDVVVGISASGNSENVIRAAAYAHDHGGSSIGLVGFDGGRMKSACQVCVHVETPAGMYELVEDVHHAICHMVTSYVKVKAST